MGFMVGGFVNAHFGWRAAFYVVGLPGVLVAILARLTVREPRAARGTSSITNAPAVGFLETLGDLWHKRACRHLVLATSIFTMGAMGSGIWLPSFFIRAHHMPAASVATWLACIYGGAGLAGALLGGFLTERVDARTGDARWYVRVPAVCSTAFPPIAVFVYLWPDPIARSSNSRRNYCFDAFMNGPCLWHDTELDGSATACCHNCREHAGYQSDRVRARAPISWYRKRRPEAFCRGSILAIFYSRRGRGDICMGRSSFSACREERQGGTGRTLGSIGRQTANHEHCALLHVF
jgi:hypothetical protein